MDFFEDSDETAQKHIPKQRNNVQPKKVQLSVKVKLKKATEEDMKADSIVKVKLEKEVGEDAKLSAGIGGVLSDVIAEKVESGDAVTEEEEYDVREIDVYLLYALT